MSSVPSINAFAAVHTRHHSGESQLKQTDQSKTVLSCTLETSSSSDNMPTCSSSNVKSDEKGRTINPESISSIWFRYMCFMI